MSSTNCVVTALRFLSFNLILDQVPAFPVRCHLLLDGLLPPRPIRTSTRPLLCYRWLVQVASRLSRNLDSACQVPLGFLLPPYDLGSWLSLGATRPRYGAVIGGRSLTARRWRDIEAILDVPLAIFDMGGRTDFVVAVRGVVGAYSSSRPHSAWSMSIAPSVVSSLSPSHSTVSRGPALEPTADASTIAGFSSISTSRRSKTWFVLSSRTR